MKEMGPGGNQAKSDPKRGEKISLQFYKSSQFTIVIMHMDKQDTRMWFEVS